MHSPIHHTASFHAPSETFVLPSPLSVQHSARFPSPQRSVPDVESFVVKGAGAHSDAPHASALRTTESELFQGLAFAGGDDDA